MDTCIKSILECDPDAEDIEILIVDDGSQKDDTAAKADEWEREKPGIIRALHKPNGGHGSAVNMGLANAKGVYYKVVDSDDWLDKEAMKPILAYLREQCSQPEPTDLVIGNYVYEKVFEGTRTVMDYKNVSPQGREFGWEDVGRFKASQYLLMHSVIYRTQMLHDIGLKLPEHCFYVDNIFVYVPLPHVKTIRYFDVDMYRYQGRRRVRRLTRVRARLRLRQRGRTHQRHTCERHGERQGVLEQLGRPERCYGEHAGAARPRCHPLGAINGGRHHQHHHQIDRCQAGLPACPGRLWVLHNG